MPTCFTGSLTTWDTWCTTSTATTSGTVWIRWCEGTSTATTTLTPTIWTTWNSTSSGYVIANQPVLETEAAHEARVARVAVWQAHEAIRLKKQEAANERAKALLLANLSAAQRDDFYKYGTFVVHGANGFRYRIREGRSGNVDRVGVDGFIHERLCAHPREAVPNFDTMLAQKLSLEDDEASFLRVANRHPVMDRAARVLEALH